MAGYRNEPWRNSWSAASGFKPWPPPSGLESKLQDLGLSSYAIKALLAKYDVTEKPVPPFVPKHGDIFQRVNGDDTIVRATSGFRGVIPPAGTPSFTMRGQDRGAWKLVLRRRSQDQSQVGGIVTLDTSGNVVAFTPATS
jgi:hypothetical protein